MRASVSEDWHLRATVHYDCHIVMSQSQDVLSLSSVLLLELRSSSWSSWPSCCLLSIAGGQPGKLLQSARRFTSILFAYIFLLSSCIIRACTLYYCNMMTWACWDWDLRAVCMTIMLFQCFDTAGLVIRPMKHRRRNDLNCVEWDVKLCSTQLSFHFGNIIIFYLWQ